MDVRSDLLAHADLCTTTSSGNIEDNSTTAQQLHVLVPCCACALKGRECVSDLLTCVTATLLVCTPKCAILAAVAHWQSVTAAAIVLMGWIWSCSARTELQPVRLVACSSMHRYVCVRCTYQCMSNDVFQYLLLPSIPSHHIASHHITSHHKLCTHSKTCIHYMHTYIHPYIHTHDIYAML